MKTRHILLIAVSLVMAIASLSYAADKILDTTIDSATTALDKNGNEYVRLIITEPRTLNGVQYQKSLPVMAFSPNVDAAKAYSAGDSVKAVVTPRDYQGSQSYTVVSFIK